MDVMLGGNIAHDAMHVLLLARDGVHTLGRARDKSNSRSALRQLAYECKAQPGTCRP